MNIDATKVKSNKRIRWEKKAIRGDEIVGFLLVILLLTLTLSAAFRFLVLGKFLDDFCFSFLFGWTKYLVYFALIFYFFVTLILKKVSLRFRFSFLVLLLLMIIVISWVVQTVSLIANRTVSWGIDNSFFVFNNYYHNWSKNNIINNYHSFFTPISFSNWHLNNFFPDYNAGGIISSAIISFFSYGTFTLNCCLAFIALIIIVTTLFFNRPLLFLLPLKQICYLIMKPKTTSQTDAQVLVVRTDKKPLYSDPHHLKISTNKTSTINSTNSINNDDVKIVNHNFPPLKSKSNYDPKQTLLTPFGFIDTTPQNNNNSVTLPQNSDSPTNSSALKNDHNFPDVDIKKQSSTPLTLNHQNRIKQYQLPELAQHASPATIIVKQEENATLAALNKSKIEKLFAEFEIQGVVSNYYSGTTVTKYEIAIQSGMRVSKITNLEDELKLALATKNIRIEAPIPGKSMVGIEVANRHILPVTLYEQFQNFPADNKNILSIAIGKSPDGEYIFHSLTNMPHLLIAGSTGAGKSVFVNTLLVSLLLKYQPYEVKLILIDPKIVELVIYNDLPHLLTPVINDVKKVPEVLQQVIKEMMERYHLLAGAQCRNIDSYNQKQENAAMKLPYYIIIIDELADLMLEVGKEVEEKIMRITQMGRAAGIHIIVATQRPSTNIITGVIKNNIPSRISFKVTSWVDSKTIIDTAGAEKLLGKGDLLFLAPGLTSPMRVQAPWISETEVLTLLTFIKNQNRN